MNAVSQSEAKALGYRVAAGPQEYKVRVFINHKWVGFLRLIDPRRGTDVPEAVITLNSARASRFNDFTPGLALAGFPQLEAETANPRKPLMPVTFQFVRI